MTEPPTPAENKALVQRVPIEIANNKNVDRADDLFAASFVDHNPLLGQIEGLQAYKSSIRRVLAAFPDLEITLEDAVAEGDRVATRLTFRGTHDGRFMGIAPTGNRVEYQIQAIFRLDNGEIIERWVLPDLCTLLDQLDDLPGSQ